MADTTNYFFNLPTVGGSSGSWGGSLNENWTKLDNLLYGASYTDGDSNTVEKIRPDLLGGSWAIDGTAVTSTAAELNILDGVTATTAELNYVDGVTSAVQTQLDVKSPTASITMYGGTSAPTGWLLCNGAAVSRSTYAALFAIVGETYGAGDGSSTFNVPDLRDKFAVGSGATYSAGATGGAATHTLTEAEMPAHTHSATSTDSGHTHVLPYGDSGGESDGWDGSGNSSTTNTGYANITTTIASTGGGGAHNNLPPYLSLAFIIKT
jgi:microcystin-dependent protein